MRLSRLTVRTRLTLWYTAVLLVILSVVGASLWSALAWSLRQELDRSLLAVAHVLRDTALPQETGGVEALLRELLGPEFYDKFFQWTDPGGGAGYRSRALGGRRLPLSPLARDNAARGEATFETIRLGDGRTLRLVTLPAPGGARLVQAATDLAPVERALARYRDILVVLIPLGLVLAAAGGALVARLALRPVDAMSRTARRITAEDLARRIETRGTGDELDRLADTLNAMLARLEGAFAETRRLAADAAHELRSPLTALKGGLEVALRTERTADGYRRVLASSLEDVERLVRLAEDLLLLSRAAAGPDGPGERVELEPLVLEAFDGVARLAKDAGLSIRLAETTPAVVRGDAAALRRALLNLVDNAVKYTPAGGGVELALRRQGAWASLVVEDTGPGIAPEDAGRIFEPFVRLRGARARDAAGAGLGLAIVRAIALAHGGGVTVEPGASGGSRFVLRLPAE
jgi:heavy metal sensor kinase